MKSGGIAAVILEGMDGMSVHDGYHSMDELYEHRMWLYITLCRRMKDDLEVCLDGIGKDHVVWKSRLHSDHTMYEDQFILGIGKHQGKQISYHLPMRLWQETEFAYELPEAPKWDAHTPADVLERLKTLFQ